MRKSLRNLNCLATKVLSKKQKNSRTLFEGAAIFS